MCRGSHQRDAGPEPGQEVAAVRAANHFGQGNLGIWEEFGTVTSKSDPPAPTNGVRRAAPSEREAAAPCYPCPGFFRQAGFPVGPAVGFRPEGRAMPGCNRGASCPERPKAQ